MSSCSVEGCAARSRTKGLCNKHAIRLRTRGTTDDGPKAHADLFERFWRKVSKVDAGCWLWTGRRSSNGYGNIQVGGKGSPVISTHRLAYSLAKGEIPPGLVVMHTCDVKTCVNPDHLMLGTISDNAVDAVEKGLHPRIAPKGEDNGKALLTEERVRFIRANPQMGHKQIADMWGLSPNAVRGVRIGRTWRHVTTS